MNICAKVPVFTRSGKRLPDVRERRAKSAIRQGQAVLIGKELKQGIRYKLPTDEEVASRVSESAYDLCPDGGRKWRKYNPAPGMDAPAIMIFAR
jgi:hypothetical protein